jgi:LuxR family maltose regulon positive regulatory protein
MFANAHQRGQDNDLETVAQYWLHILSSPQAVVMQPLEEPLTETEIRVLHLMQSEMSYPEIARLCHVSLNTIKTHRRHIFNKLNVHSRDEAIQKARDLHLL